MSSEKPPMYEPPQAGYQGEPPQGGYPAQPPQQGGYPAQPPPPQGGYPAQPPPPQGAGYPPPHGYQGPPPVQTGPVGVNTVIVTQARPGAMPGSNMRYGQAPAMIVCQHCQATVTTSLDYESGLLTWLLVGGLCIIGCWLGCCLIPLCIDPLKDVSHRCPNCNNNVGRFRHFS